MEKQNVKRGRGRPKKYSTEEEKKEATKQLKTKYMLNKPWYCDTCGTGRNYTLAGKWGHLNTKKHRFNDKIFKMLVSEIGLRDTVDILYNMQS